MRRRLISRTGVTVQKCDSGPYTSPGRMIVHGTSPRRVRRKHRLLARDLRVHVRHAGRCAADSARRRRRDSRARTSRSRRSARSAARHPRAAASSAWRVPSTLTRQNVAASGLRPMPTIAAVWITHSAPCAASCHAPGDAQVTGNDAARRVGAHVQAAHLGARLAVTLREPPADQAERAGDEHAARGPPRA